MSVVCFSMLTQITHRHHIIVKPDLRGKYPIHHTSNTEGSRNKDNSPKNTSEENTPEAFYDANKHPGASPFILVACDHKNVSQEGALYKMIENTFSQLKPILKDVLSDCPTSTQLIPEQYSESLLNSIETAIPRVPNIKFPYADKDWGLVSIIIDIEGATNEKTMKMVKRFIILLEDIFVANEKGKLVFIGKEDSDAIRCLRQTDTAVVKVMYEDDTSYHYLV